MKISLVALLLLSFSLLIFSGCQSAQQSSGKLLEDTTAFNYSLLSVQTFQAVTKSIINWSQSGNVSSGIMLFGVKSASVGSKSVTGPDANGYYHIVTSESNAIFGTYEANTYVKLVKDGQNRVTDCYLYGTASIVMAAGSNSLSLSLTFGNGTNPLAADFNAFHGTSTWTNNDLTALSASGPLSMTVVNNQGLTAQTTVSQININNFSWSLTPGLDFPIAKLTLSFSVNQQNSPYDIVITCDGTAVATMKYGDYSANIPLSGN